MRHEKGSMIPLYYVIACLVTIIVSIIYMPKLQNYIHRKPAPQLVPIKERLEAIYIKETSGQNEVLLEAISKNLDLKLEEYIRRSKSNKIARSLLHIMFDTNDSKTLIREMEKRGFKYINKPAIAEPYFILFELPEETPLPAQPLTRELLKLKLKKLEEK